MTTIFKGAPFPLDPRERLAGQRKVCGKHRYLWAGRVFAGWFRNPSPEWSNNDTLNTRGVTRRSTIAVDIG